MERYTDKQLESMAVQAEVAATKQIEGTEHITVQQAGAIKAAKLFGVALGLRIAADLGMSTKVPFATGNILIDLDPNKEIVK